MEELSKTEKKSAFLRRLFLTVFIIVTFLFQNTGGLFPEPFGIRALLLIPLTVCIAMFEGEFSGLFFGLAAGAVLDAFNAQTICFNGIAYTLIGFAAGALITHLMRNNILCAFILSLIMAFLYRSVDFIFHYAFSGGATPLLVYFKYYFLSAVFTALLTPIYYFIVRTIERKYNKDSLTLPM